MAKRLLPQIVRAAIGRRVGHSIRYDEGALATEWKSLHPANDEYRTVLANFGSTKVPVKIAYAYGGTFIKPAQRCYDYYFEQFFGFGCGNLGYSTEATTFVPYTYVSKIYGGLS